MTLLFNSIQQAMLQRGKLYLQDGQFQSGLQDVSKYIQLNPTDADMQQLHENAKAAHMDLVKADLLYNTAKFEEAIEVYSSILVVAQSSVDLRMRRADCYVARGEKEMAIGDLIYPSFISSVYLFILLVVPTIYVQTIPLGF